MRLPQPMLINIKYLDKIFVGYKLFVVFYQELKMTTVTIVFIADKNYVMPTAVTMTSAVKNKKNSTRYEFIILGSGLGETERQKLQAASGGEKVRIINIDVGKYQNVVSKTHVSIAALCKFEIADILPELDKVLYLDGDIIVQDDLSVLFATDIEGYYVAAVKDAYVLEEQRDGFKTEGYFNSGVMLLNCRRMRQEKMSEKLWSLKQEHRDLLFMDQDVFNLAFAGKVKYLDLRYNFMAAYFRPKYFPFLLKIYNDAEYVRAQSATPAIIHYTGKNPWQYYHRIGAEIWRGYYNESPYGGEKLHYRDNLAGKLKKLLPERRERADGKVEVFWGHRRLFAYWNRNSEYQKIYARRFDDALTEDEKKYILSVQLSKVVDYKPDLDHPQTFSEKIQWLKLHYHNPLLTKCADKYAVREYVEEKIGGQYLIPLLGVWDKPEDIDFDALPNAFALKVNWGSGQNIIVKDKSKLDRKKTVKKLIKWMQPRQNHYYYALEWAYKNIKPKIIAEQYIEQTDGQVFDYKFRCADGKPINILLCRDRKRGVVYEDYDLEWNAFAAESSNIAGETPRPANLELMIELAEKLAGDFPFVRVDFYDIDGRVYFGELTFYPGGGYNHYYYEWDMRLGKAISLP